MQRAEEACQRTAGRAVEQAAARFSVQAATSGPGFRLAIGVESDPPAWLEVANAPLDPIASGGGRAGSRVLPVTALGLESPVVDGAAARAFCTLAEEDVLHWVPGRSYAVRTRFTVAVGGRPYRGGGPTAVLPGRGPRHA